MGYKIVETNSFQKDLDHVISYIVLALKNGPAAAALLDAVDKCYDGLEQTPFMYAACNDPYLKELGYRKAGVKNYIIVYKVDEAAKTVNIMRLFHGRQDYEKLI